MPEQDKPQQVPDLPEDPVAAALVESMRLDNEFVDCGVGQALREEFDEDDGGEENYYRHRDALVRAAFALVRWHHNRVMTMLDAAHPSKRAYVCEAHTLYEYIRMRLEALAPSGRD